MTKSEYCNYILDLLSPMGNITARTMFGGYGIYMNHVIFGIIANDILYFKVDDTNRNDYINKGSEPFSYEAKRKKNIIMSYWQVPLDILEDSEVLYDWANKSCCISKNKKKTKKLL
jgi:DNA transformation protein and related proteins